MASIYKITSPSYPGKCYIGSTICGLTKRLQNHYSDFKRNRNLCSSFQLLDKNDAVIELLEMCPIENRRVKEQFHIDANDCVNKINACPTSQQIIEKRRILEKQKYMRHKRAICIICDIECGKKYLKEHFQRFHTAK
jgi:hypothetical protein